MTSLQVARRWGHLADDQLSSDDYMEQHERRRLTLAVTFGGAVHIEGLLDPDGGAVVMAAIDKLSLPDPVDTPDGPRTTSQRRADALVQLAGSVLAGGDGADRAAINLNVIADIDRLAGSSCHRPILERRSDLEWMGPVGRETLLRLGCDCSVSRVVMKGRSEILDMGRTTRLVTSVQRRALSIRDGGCVFTGCDRPDSWGDAHRLEHWALDGPTDLDNLAFLCRRHHVLCREGGWQLSPDPGGGFRARAPDR